VELQVSMKKRRSTQLEGHTYGEAHYECPLICTKILMLFQDQSDRTLKNHQHECEFRVIRGGIVCSREGKLEKNSKGKIEG